MSDFRGSVKRRPGWRLTPSGCLTYKAATPHAFSHLRSVLFAPGSDEDKLRKALSGEAHAVVCDLEDGVAPAEKERARELIVELLAEVEAACARMVRVNAPASPYFEADLEAFEN